MDGEPSAPLAPNSRRSSLQLQLGKRQFDSGSLRTLSTYYSALSSLRGVSGWRSSLSLARFKNRESTSTYDTARSRPWLSDPQPLKVFEIAGLVKIREDIEPIRSGGYATVRQGVWISTSGLESIPVAVKILREKGDDLIEVSLSSLLGTNSLVTGVSVL